jgi:anti-sigma regulatory factor (Ser/Thr protein kinase)
MQCSFPADPSAPGVARRSLEGMDGTVDRTLIERGSLAVTEVVTNSVVHAGLASSQQIELTVALQPELLRIEVSDDGPGFLPEPVASKPDHAPGGWGLWMVDQLADRWGVDRGPGTRVWLEFDRA